MLDLQQLKSNRGRSGGEVEVYRFDSDGSALRTMIPRAENRSYERRTVRGHKDRILSVSFSADGRWFSTTSADRTVRIWNTESGQLHRQLVGHPGSVRQAVFSPDGKYIATRSSDLVVRVFLVDNGYELVKLRGHRGRINWLTFSADSQRLLTASEDGTSRLWHVDPLPAAMQQRPRRLTDDESVRYGIPHQAE